MTRAPAAVVLALALLGSGCREPAFRFSATFPGPVEVTEGAEVRYQGVPVGEVEAVELSQPAPEEPAVVVFRIAIYDPVITLREADLIELASGGILADDYLSITASPDPSIPLEPGVTVAGTPPLTTRIGSAAGTAYDSVAEFIRAQADAFSITLGADTLGGTGAPTAGNPPAPLPERP